MALSVRNEYRLLLFENGYRYSMRMIEPFERMCFVSLKRKLLIFYFFWSETTVYRIMSLSHQFSFESATGGVGEARSPGSASGESVPARSNNVRSRLGRRRVSALEAIASLSKHFPSTLVQLNTAQFGHSIQGRPYP
jgi:hypothetical protein